MIARIVDSRTLRLVAPLVGVCASGVFAQTPLAPSAGGQTTQRAANQAVQLPSAPPARSDAEAIESELVTDRPDFTESSEVVGHGVLQLETGFTFESDRLDHVLSRSITTPALLLRFGIGPRFELRFGADGFLRGWTNESAERAVSGYSDVDIAAKVKFLDRDRFDMAVIPIVTIPTGDRYYSSNTYNTTVKLTWAADLPRNFGLSGNVNASRLSSELGWFSQGAVSVSLGHDLGAGWGGYWEGYVFEPMGPSLGSGWTVNTGVTRGIGNNMQFDIEAGRGVTAAAPDWFVGVGFAVRKGLVSSRR